MDPKKVKTATVITIVVAIILILICLCLMFDWVRLPALTHGKSEPEPETPTESTESAEPVQTNKPGEHDLRGASEKLYHPEEESYLNEYKTMIVRPAEGATAYLQYKPEQIQYYTDAITKLENGAKVTALAQENGYTLLLVQDGVVGWVLSYYLSAK